MQRMKLVKLLEVKCHRHFSGGRRLGLSQARTAGYTELYQADSPLYRGVNGMKIG